MRKKYIILQLLILINFFAQGQSSEDNAFLLRKHIDKDSTWIVQNTGCYFIKETGMKENHFGWFQLKELIKKNCNLLYFEANTFGSMRLVVELPKEIREIKFDTLSENSYQLINHHYGNLRRDFEQKSNTIDYLSGTLSFVPLNENEISINGIINIDTKKPVTHQEIVFKNYNSKINSLNEIIEIQRQEEIANQKQQKKEWGAFELVSIERAKFYDSIFSIDKFPGNNLKANINGKIDFDFVLNNSFILTNAILTDSAKQDLGELLGGNILVSLQGNKKVFTLHSFYDPIKNAIDDETNYSLAIELDTIIVGKTYQTNKKEKDFNVKLAFWNYGPEGTVITSKKTQGTLTIIEDSQSKTSGILSIVFKNEDKSTISLNGKFELPKLNISAINELEDRIKNKLEKYFEKE
jgi:hypothetical protein